MSDARDHHFVPQFYLRNFAIDAEKRWITTLGKHGPVAVWTKRSIEHLGYERDLYVHFESGRPVSVEDTINRHIETPISQSDTWVKITSGQTEALDRSDKPILYALIRHLEMRNPHALRTRQELMDMAASSDSEIAFTDEERAMYAELRRHPELQKQIFNMMSADLAWTERDYKSAALTVVRTSLPLRSSTTPVLPMPIPAHPSSAQALPGMVPHAHVLVLNPRTVAMLNLGDFDGVFINVEGEVDVAKGLGRCFVGQFGKFAAVRHLISGREDLVTDMDWAGYALEQDTPTKLVFRSRAAREA